MLMQVDAHLLSQSLVDCGMANLLLQGVIAQGHTLLVQKGALAKLDACMELLHANHANVRDGAE